MIEAIRSVLNYCGINNRTSLYAQTGHQEVYEVIVHPNVLDRTFQLLENTGYFVKTTPDRRLMVTR